MLFVLSGAAQQCPPIHIEPAFENLYKNHPYWYKGQTHAHADYRPYYDEWGDDPKQKPYELEQDYRDAGYHFIALTHYHIIILDPGVASILHINGEEDGDWDWPYNPPHIIGINITSTSDDDDWTCQERINHFINQGGLAIIAHPHEPTRVVAQ